jgi:hypothetical protein
MHMTFRSSILGAAVGATACTVLLAGCSGGYYMVREPGSATPYYTTDIDKAGSAVQFTDARTGSAVTLQNSEIKEISKDDFTKGVSAPAPVPAAAAAPAPAAAGTSAPAPAEKSQ